MGWYVMIFELSVHLVSEQFQCAVPSTVALIVLFRLL